MKKQLTSESYCTVYYIEVFIQMNFLWYLELWKSI